jgi:hypothetical protein
VDFEHFGHNKDILQFYRQRTKKQMMRLRCSVECATALRGGAAVWSALLRVAFTKALGCGGSVECAAS